VKTSHQQVRFTGYCDATRTNTNIYTQLLFSPSVSSWLFTLQSAMAVRYLSCRRLSCRKRPVFYFAIAIICAKNTSIIKSILCEVILFWSEVSYGEVLGEKSATCNRVTLYWEYVIILWLFHLGISCTVFVLICTVVVLTCFVMCGLVYVWVL